MLKHFTIAGFKSFGSPGSRIDLEPLSFVVGANASGKSNILAALKFLRQCFLHGVEIAVNELDGCREVRNRIQRQKSCSISLCTCDLPANLDPDGYSITRATYEMSLDLRSDEDRPTVDTEKLIAKIIGPLGELEYRLERNGLKIEIEDPLAKDMPTRRSFDLYPQEAGKLVAANGLSGLPAILFREYIGKWRFYNISPELARLASKESIGTDLSEHGENLAVVLNEIRNQDPDQLKEICAWLATAVPGFDSVDPVKLAVEGKWAFQVAEKRIKGGLNPQSVSDGTVRLLSLMVIVAWVSKKSSLVCIEEPENGVHPHLAESFVSALRAVSQETQFLVTTHNPSFLDYLKPAELLLVDKKEGITEIRRASDIDDIAVFSKKFALGDLWTQGMLEGFPS